MIPDDLTLGPRFAAFTEHYIRQTKGRWAGSPLVLEGWEREFWWEALEVDPTTGLRVYQEVGLGVPRKNGKSTQASGGGLYFLIADGEAEPEVYVAAAARPQARIIFTQAARMAAASPRLRDHVRILKHWLECPRNGGLMRPLSADAGVSQGLNPSASILDEVHAHADASMYEALTTATGAREQPFTLWISTAGEEGRGILGDLYRLMFDGPGEVELRPGLTIYRDRANGVLTYWYGAPNDADPDDPAVWAMANPASWLADVSPAGYLARQHAKMKARGAMQAWRRFHLNQMISSEAAWLPPGAWDRCVGVGALRTADPIGVGVYKSSDATLAAVVVAQRQGERVIVRAEHFTADPDTGRVSSEAIRQHVVALRATYPVPAIADPRTKLPLAGPAVAYDRWQFGESAEGLGRDGLNMVNFPQYASTMGPATQAAFELITTGRIVHDGDPTLAEHVQRTAAVLTNRGMQAIPGRGERPPNPAAIAMLTAVAMAMQPRPTPARPRTMTTFS